MNDAQKIKLIQFLFDPNVREIYCVEYTAYYNEHANTDHAILVEYRDNGGNPHKVSFLSNGLTRTHEI